MRKRRGREDSAFADASATERPIDDLVSEGMLIVTSALRLAAKNDLILRAVRDRDDYDRDALLDSVRASMRALIAEKREEGERLQTLGRRAKKRGGNPLHVDDYRREDLPALRARAALSGLLAERVESLLDDDDYTGAIVDEARNSALHELVQPSLPPRSPAETDRFYASERLIRMEQLKQDLDEMIWERWD